MDLGLTGLKALVSGGSRGLGYATATALAADGAAVAINGRDAARMAAPAAAIHALAIPGDVSSAAAVKTLVDTAAEKLGGLDLLFCNAGGPPSGPFENFSDEQWQKAVDTSFMSAVWLVRAALPYLRKSKAASVLFVASYSVKQPIPNLVLSNSIRAATVGLSKTLALELGGDGIRFNAILPGWTATDRITELMAARAKTAGTTVAEELAKQAKDCPLGRMGRPEEFANAAAFLLSPAASYITGVALTVDGGMYKGTL
jgi:3-oxoacyl-[acyl-carrier protein] reductase